MPSRVCLRKGLAAMGVAVAGASGLAMIGVAVAAGAVEAGRGAAAGEDGRAATGVEGRTGGGSGAGG
jgi:hypothetical protein